MKYFSASSQAKLSTAHPDLQRLFVKVLQTFDCMILEGHRDEATQNKAFAEGKSKLKWPNGEHNTLPSRAVDVAPTPLDWNDTQRFYYFAGYVMATAQMMGIKIRWGGDWNQNTQTKDETFKDLVHFELG